MRAMLALLCLFACTPASSTKTPPSPTTTQPSAESTPTLLKDPTFLQWDKEKPTHWQTSVGAGAGEPSSKVEALPGGGIALEGDNQTGSWQLISQRFTATSNTWYRLHFEAVAKSLGQGRFDNCWVGFAFFDESGKRIWMEVSSILEGDPAAQDLFVRTPPQTSYGEVRLFLSRPGRLEVKLVQLEVMTEKDSFDVLVGVMDRYYSFFEVKKIDWPSLTAKYQEKAKAAKDPNEFAGVIGEMLNNLQDMHTYATPPGGKPIYAKLPSPTFNIELSSTLKQLKDIQQLKGVALGGSLEGGFGYFVIVSMQDEASFPKVEAIFEGILTSPGIVIDMRGNGGGAEKLGLQLLSRLTAQEREYAPVMFRNGIGHNQFTTPSPRKILPGKGPAYNGKIAVLIGPGCVSSCEGMTAMLRALPNARLFGQPTRGASGNPAPIALPNGVSVAFSRWVVLLPDGTPLEGKGIAPDEVVTHTPGGDATLQAALSWLQQP